MNNVKQVELEIPGTGTSFRIRLNNQRTRIVVTKVNDEDNSVLVCPLVSNQLELF